ncbi:hypothetical protein JCM3766R1_002697 [Sporobolomyces carnicolor]
MSNSRTRAEVLSDLSSARVRIAQLEAELASLSSSPSSLDPSSATATRSDHAPSSGQPRTEWPLSLREYKRYGRQMLITPVGLPGQLKLKHAHILVVGAGGLGCPVLLYLAAAGVGEITILDHDTVELSNLHRQVLHTEDRVGMSKALSAKLALEALNSDIKINAHQLPFVPSIFHSSSSSTTTSTTPSSLLEPGHFSLVLDCTDNPATRHFLNSFAVAMNVPLVSGGAVRAEGTVGVYGLSVRKELQTTIAEQQPRLEVGEEKGPCYACIFPPPPPRPAATIDQTPLERDLEAQRQSLAGTGACSDEGVLGINCGIVGIGMAAEAVKVLLGMAKPTLHLFAPLSPSPYRTIKTRARKPTCPACGTFDDVDSDISGSSPSNPDRDGKHGRRSSQHRSTPESRWREFLESDGGEWPGWQDPLCAVPGVGESVEPGRVDERVRAKDLKEWCTVAASNGDREGESEIRIIDTRPEPEFGIVNLRGSVNIPFAKFLKNPALALPPSPTTTTTTRGSTSLQEVEPKQKTVAFVCRRGNDSLLASRALRRWLDDSEESRVADDAGSIRIVDVVGGLTAYAKEEEGFPVY